MEETIPGLSSEQAKKLHAQYGYNILPQKAESQIKRWLKQFWGPLPWLLEIVSLLSLYSGDWLEAIIIIFLLITNSFISLFQQSRTDTALKQLRSSLEVDARVKRDNQWVMLAVSQLVPGDLIRLRAGDVVSADMHLISGNVSVDQSSITGESLAVERENQGVIYSGSVIVRGEAGAIVDSIGSNTKYGTTAELLETSHPPTHMEKIVFKIIKYQFVFNLCLIIFLIVFVLLDHQKTSDILPLTIVLLITSIPIAFPTMFSVSQTFGASKLANLGSNKGILVRRLAAIQDCASMDVLCTDKTGTLTKNSLSVSQLITYNNFSQDDLIEIAAACSNLADQDPIDKAVLEYLDLKKLKKLKSSNFVPFDPLTKKTSAFINRDGKKAQIVKGLPEIVAKECLNIPKSLQADLLALSQKGYRIIAVNIGEHNHKKLVGLIAFEDPIRDDSVELLKQIAILGIDVKMITGDNLQTAETVAKKLGMTPKVISADQLKDDPKLALQHNVFANAYPKDKLLIISQLQKSGHVVGMTGDGVNDAPALHQAEVGIAVASATDIAKSSASFILTNPGLVDILSACRVSREVYQRIRTWALNKIIKSFEVALLLSLTFVITKNILITPLLGVLFLFANDFVTISIATDRASAEAFPAKWSLKKLIYSAMSLAFFMLMIVVLGLILAKSLFSLSYLELSTLAFVMLVLQGQASLYSLRSWPNFWHVRPSQTLFIASISVALILLIMSMFGLIIKAVPLGTLIFILLVPIMSLLVLDYLKHFLPIRDN